MNQAKSNLLLNVTTGQMVVIFNVLLNLWMTPYLIKNLTLEIYGVIPIVITLISYVTLFTRVIAETVTRFVAIHFGNGNISESNRYYNSAFTGLNTVLSFLLIPIALVVIFANSLFNLPNGSESDSRYLFALVLLGTILMAISGLFAVGPIIKHQIYKINAVKYIYIITRVVLLYFSFRFFGPSLKYFGIAYLMSTIVFLVGSVVTANRSTPELKITIGTSDKVLISRISQMGLWTFINELGALLYLGVAIFIINIFMGPKASGVYGAVMVLGSVVIFFGGSIVEIFSPIAYEHIAKRKYIELASQTSRAIKYMTIIVGLPVTILCGLAKPILTVWLGNAFSDYEILAWLIIAPWLFNIAIKPVFPIFRGMDKVRIPAIITLVGGVLNVVLSILLIKITPLGINSVALSILVCLLAKNLLFTPFYCSHILNVRTAYFIKPLFPGAVLSIVFILLTRILFERFGEETFLSILMSSAILGLAYSCIAYFLILTKSDRKFFKSLVVK